MRTSSERTKSKMILPFEKRPFFNLLPFFAPYAPIRERRTYLGLLVLRSLALLRFELLTSLVELSLLVCISLLGPCIGL